MDIAERRFTTTCWSEVARAADSDPRVRREALERLLRKYLPAFDAHLRLYRRIPSHEAQDLLQGFVCDQVVAADMIRYADQKRGRFRTFMLHALDRYCQRAKRQQLAQKRMPQGKAEAVGEWNEPVSGSLAPAEEFDLAWARQTILDAVEQMRCECKAKGQQQLWELFDFRMLRPILEGAPAPRYAELVERFGLSSPAQGSNLLVTAKRMLVRTLRRSIEEYAQSEGEVEAELRDLWMIFARRGAAFARFG